MELYLGPHLDDIALSCGGRVFARGAAGVDVLAVTLCAGDTPPDLAASPAVRRVHDEWRLSGNPYAARRREDRRACRHLGACCLQLPLLDAVYRRDAAGRMLYSRKFLGARIKPYDQRHHARAVEAALRDLHAKHPQARVFVPLAIGGHVDHVVVRAAAERVFELRQLRYYEDFPYVARATPEEITAATHGLIAQPFALTRAALEAKVGAIALYESQLFALFRARERAAALAAMRLLVGEYSRRVNGERYWAHTQPPGGRTA
ncbi:MAG: PIG-L family deacetylase [Thermoflexales bacterium]|nr:PIG-L family deacetylase [Thermoflexales bacterium]